MIKQRITDPMVKDHLDHIAPDGREIYLLLDGQVRLTAVDGTLMLNEMQSNFHTGVLETVVLGKAYLAGALLASTVKGNDRLLLTVECGGPIGGYTVEAWACGAVRGSLKHNPIPLEKPLKDSNLSPLYGPGFLTITKILEGEKQPFTGQVMIEYGNLAKDLALYFQQSEQTPSLFDLSVQFDKGGHPSGAGGLFFQVMPSCSEDAITALENATKSLKPLGAYLETGKDIKSYIEEQFAALKPKHLGSTIVGFSCPCNKEHFGDYLAHLNEKEKEDILSNGPFPLDLTCVNCGSVYSFSKEELEKLLKAPTKA
jgi:molecular chaperone Hsp33